MASFDEEIGANCEEPSCRQKVYLPYRCSACNKTFCESHYRYDAHACKEAAAQAEAASAAAAEARKDGVTASLVKCAAPDCRESLAAHNTIRCGRCKQAVCLKHRYEDSHSCLSAEQVATGALAQAKAIMSPEEFADAHSTLSKVFGNILNDPSNGKFRTLKKSNAIVSQKLRHPASIEALRLTGFKEMPDSLTCPMTTDLKMMRHMYRAMQAAPPTPNPPAATPSRPTSAATSSASGARLVNGVIVRDPPPPAQPAASTGAAPAATATTATATAATAASATAAAAAAAAASPSPTSSSSSSVAVTPKPKSAFDFKRRVDREKMEKEQQSSMEELRQMRKERYQAGGPQNPNGNPTARTSTSTAQSNNSNSDSKDSCCLQ